MTERLPPISDQLPEPWGEVPQDPASIPGIRHIDSVSSPVNLEGRVQDHLSQHPHLDEIIKKGKKDVAAWASAHGAGLAITTSIAALGLAAGVGIVLYRRGKRVQE